MTANWYNDATINFLTMRDREPSIYQVTVRLEDRFLSGTGNGDWVARDADGNWRAHCAKHFAPTAAAAVAMMFHADEVGSVTDCGEYAIAMIREY